MANKERNKRSARKARSAERQAAELAQAESSSAAKPAAAKAKETKAVQKKKSNGFLASVKGYFAKFGRPAKNLSSSFRSLVEFYSRGERWNEAHNALEAKRGDETYLVRDDAKVLEWFLANRVLPLDELVAKCAANADFWGEDIRAYL